MLAPTSKRIPSKWSKETPKMFNSGTALSGITTIRALASKMQINANWGLEGWSLNVNRMFRALSLYISYDTSEERFFVDLILCIKDFW